MSSTPIHALSLPPLKSFALTHILYDPTSPLSIPLTLLSLSPIFLFVAYLTLVVFTRRLSVALLALGSIANEALSLALKRACKGERPYRGHGEVGDGYGMPSSHSQAAGFVCAWGLGYAWARARAQGGGGGGAGRARTVVRGIYVLGLVLWSLLVAYSRWHLLYHSPSQVFAGYTIGLIAGAAHFMLTEHIPRVAPRSVPGRIRAGVEWVWTGVGGVGGFGLGDAPGGWGEGHLSGTAASIESGTGRAEADLAKRGKTGKTR